MIAHPFGQLVRHVVVLGEQGGPGSVADIDRVLSVVDIDRVVDRLKELDLPVVGVNVAESESARSATAPGADTDVSFNRLRDELWWRGREWLEARDCHMLDDEETIGELTTPTYSILSNGKIKVEGKDEMKARGVKSPNRADAWLLTFHEGGFPRVGRSAPIKYRTLGMRRHA